MKKTRDLFRSEKGQALPLVALLMVVLFGFAAFVVDVGLMYSSKAKLQSAADSAALAAALDIPPVRVDGTYINKVVVDAQIIATGESYAQKNGLPPDSISPNATIVTPMVPQYKVKVTVTETVEHFFARVLNINSSTISATAVARRYAVWDGSVLPLINLNEEYLDKVGTGESIEIREKFDDSTSDRDWLYVSKYMAEQNVTAIENVRINPADGLMVTKGGTQDYIWKYLEPLLKYPGPYFMYTISQEVLNDLGGTTDAGIGVYDGGSVPTTRFLMGNNGKLSTFENSDRVAPFARKVNGKYVPCNKDDVGAVEQIKILRVDSVALEGTGSNMTVEGTIESVHSIDFDFTKDTDFETVIGKAKSKLTE